MGSTGNCYENAVAERVNGILKDEYLLDSEFIDIRQAKQQQVRLYIYTITKGHIGHYNLKNRQKFMMLSVFNQYT